MLRCSKNSAPSSRAGDIVELRALFLRFFPVGVACTSTEVKSAEAVMLFLYEDSKCDKSESLEAKEAIGGNRSV